MIAKRPACMSASFADAVLEREGSSIDRRSRHVSLDAQVVYKHFSPRY